MNKIKITTFSGSDNVDGKLDKIFQLVQAQKSSMSTTSIEEFLLIFQLLAFLACAGKAPIRQQMLDETLARVKEAGDPENILRWCFWTKDQHTLMAMADKLSRVILIGGNGTGKTYMLDAFTMKSAKEHPDENLTFAIHQASSSPRPLLQLDLEVKYENARLQNVSVVTFEKISELADANLLNHTVCVDEITMDRVKPEDLNAIQSRSLWIVIRDTHLGKENPEEYLRQKFPDWVIVNLSYPLRTSKNLSVKIKDGQVSGYLHSNIFNSSLKVAPNMPLGPEPLILLRSEGSYHARIHQAFSAMVKDMPTLIILDIVSMKPTPEEMQTAKATTSHQELAEKRDLDSKHLLVAIEAVTACQRPHGSPLLWFESDYAYVSDGRDSIKEWMKGKNRRISCRDLITDDISVAGYEADFVIYLGSSSNVSAFMSRCRGQFVHIE